MNFKQLLTGVASWNNVYDKLMQVEISEGNNEAGKLFELMAKYYFLYEPSICAEFKRVWLYDEVPSQLKKDLDLPKIDHGIDILLQNQDGFYIGLQCKRHKDQTKMISWSGDKLANALASGNKLDGIGYFTNASTIDKETDRKAKQKAHSGFYCLEQLLELNAEFFQTCCDTIDKKTPKPSAPAKPDFDKDRGQVLAIRNILNGFKKADRGQLIAHCGWGKTLVSFWIYQKMAPKVTVFCAPRLHLLKQTKKEWAIQSFKNKKKMSYVMVCSDETVDGENTEDTIIELSHIGETNVVDNQQDLTGYLTKHKEIVIFSTYQSLDLVGVVFNKMGIKADLLFADEAHKTASGNKEANFTFVHKDKNIPAKKRLYMTATPKIVADSTIQKIKDKGYDPTKVAFSMDDSSIFGEVFYEINFGQGIEKGIICDYRIVLVGVDSDEVKQYIEHRRYVAVGGGEASVDEVANVIAVEKTMKKYGLKHTITFHTYNSYAQNFSNIYPELYKNGTFIRSLNGGMSTASRASILDDFASSSKGIISNARCLQEGIDVPSVDMVAFCDPKNSKIDIGQSVGRGLRLDKKNPDKIAYVLIPLYHSKDDNKDDIIQKGCFRTLVGVVRALKERDFRLEDEIKNIRLQKGVRKPNHVSTLIDNKKESILLSLEGFEKKLAAALWDEILERSGFQIRTWDDWMLSLTEFFNQNGHSNVPIKGSNASSLGNWVGVQRGLYKNGKLKKNQIDRLNKVGFVWSPFDETWNETYELLCDFQKKNGHCNVPAKYPILGSWVFIQRDNYNDGLLDEVYIDKLKAIGFEFGSMKTLWWNGKFKMLSEFFGKNGHCNVPTSEKVLNNFIGVQRLQYKNGKLSKDREYKLRGLGLILEYVHDVTWNKNYELLSEFFGKNGHCNVPQSQKPLGTWVSGLRSKKHRLSKEQVNKLNLLGFDWNPIESLWKKTYNAIVDYKKEHGHCNVLIDGSSLGAAVVHLRVMFRKGELPKGKEKQLRDIGFDFITSNFNHRNSKVKREKNVSIFNSNLSKWVKQNSSGKFDKSTSSWATTQRIAFKNGTLENWKINKLKDSEFVFDQRSEGFNEFCEKLLEFQKIHGHVNVPSNYENRSALAGWVVNLRVRYRQGHLEKNEIKKLKDVGFIFDGKKAALAIRKAKLKDDDWVHPRVGKSIGWIKERAKEINKGLSLKEFVKEYRLKENIYYNIKNKTGWLKNVL